MPTTLTISGIIARDNLKLVDAKKDIVIHLKKCDVHAVRKSPEHCAFANACHREVRGVKRAIFTRSVAYLQVKDKLIRYTLPAAVRQEIMTFDRGGQLAPGEYILKAASPKNRLGMTRSRKAKRKRPYGPRKQIANIRLANY